MKVCTQCSIDKDGNEFPKCRKNKDGLYSWCKECSKAKTRAYALSNPEAVKASRDKRKNIALAIAREYKRKNKERLDKLKKAHYYKNRERICEKAREYSKNLSEEKRKRKHKYYLKWSKTENAKKYKNAHKAVYRGLQKGILVRSNKCVLCFSEEKTEAHHPNYDKPLEVVWLCRKCHGRLHRK